MIRDRVTKKELRRRLREHIIKSVPGLLIALDVYSVKMFGKEFIDICLEDLNRAHEVLLAATGGDEELTDRIMRILVLKALKEEQ